MFGRGYRWALFLLTVSVLPVLLLCAGGSVSASQEQVIPEVYKSGWYEPGEYQVPCGNFPDPPDAVQLGPAGPAGRSPQVNERGMLSVVITSVRKRSRDGRLIEPNLVEAAKDGDYCVVVLRQPGTYQVTMENTISNWIWVVSEAASSVSALRLISKPLPSKFERKEFRIYVRGDCPEEGSDQRDAPEASGDDPVADRLREALLRALSEKGQEVDGNSVSIEQTTPGGLWRFAVRISHHGCVLPSHESIADCSSPEPGSATAVLVGSLQIAGGKSRINARIFDVETGEIWTAAKGDTQGSDTDALAQAASDALHGLAFPMDCTNGVSP